MSQQRYAVFLINLVQDVNIVRPLVYMAKQTLGLKTLFMVSHLFEGRDKQGGWMRELIQMAEATGSHIYHFNGCNDVFRVLQGASGVIIAASESNLSAHTPTHEVVSYAPPSFSTITLQHGFECVGFLQSRDHILAHGQDVTFGSDIVCGWCEPERLTTMAPSQRGKLVVTGPPAVLQTPQLAHSTNRMGLVCENLHSVRLNVAGNFKADFIDIFGDFCRTKEEEGESVTLRPHPGGQYVLRNDVPLPPNVIMNNKPMYKVDLTRFAYGISAPSSVVIDMVLAGIPVGVWGDTSGIMDLGNYTGLTAISSLQDWIDFSREASEHPQRFLDLQDKFIQEQLMPTDPADVFQRYAEILDTASHAAPAPVGENTAKERIMMVANGMVPTMQISFLKPFRDLQDTGEVAIDIITEQELTAAFKKDSRSEPGRRWVARRLGAFRPTMLVLCRYSGPQVKYMIEWARCEGIPVIYHIDDDLLNVPKDLGEAKHKAHSSPERVGAVRHGMNHADMVYCSTVKLKKRLDDLGIRAPKRPGKIYCSGKVLSPAVDRPVRKIGYMASADHAHNLTRILPGIVEFLKRNEHVGFELFGSIPKPKEFEQFGDRITSAAPIANYDQFLTEFAKYEWDIGICPLSPIQFNMMKANTKWVEYTSVGAAVVASRGTVYDDCCADGCGILAETPEEWLAALDRLTNKKGARFEQVKRAQEKLTTQYSLENLREQVQGMFAEARALNVSRAGTNKAA